MALSFDHTAKRVGVLQADAQPLLMQSLINAIRTEEASERGIAYDQIADATGKADLGGGVLTGITVALRSTWALSFAAGAYQATVDGGNLADGLARVANTGSPQVLLRSSAAATVVQVVAGSGLSTEQATQLAELHEFQALKPGAPVTTTATQQGSAAVKVSIIEAADSITVERI